MQRIYSYYQTKEYSKALDLLLNLCETESGNKSEIYLEIAKIYSDFLNDKEKALHYLTLGQKCAQDNKLKGIFYFEIGKLKVLDNKYDVAIDNLEKSLSYLNQDDDVYIYASVMLSKAYADTRRYALSSRLINNLEKNDKFIADKAKYGYDTHIQRYPGNYDFSGDYNKLIGTYKEILAENPYDKQIICFLAQTYNYMGLYTDTIELYKNNADKVTGHIFFENKLLNEYEIASGKTILQSKPRNLMAVLSNKCNLKCVMCRSIENDWELPKERLGEIKNLFPYLERILWQGGEVLLLSYFKDILKESLQYPNIKQAVLTNFQLVDDEMLCLIVNNGIELRVSIDGATKDVYEKIRRGGSFERLCSNLEKLYKIRQSTPNNMSLNMNVVVMRENYKQLSLFADFAKKYHFDFITLTAIESPVDDDIKLNHDIFANPKDDELEYMSYQVMLLKQKTEQLGIQLEVRFSTVDITDELIKKYSDGTDKPTPLKQELPCAHEKKDEREIPTPLVTNACDVTANNITKKIPCHLPWNTLTLYYDGSILPDCLCGVNNAVGHLSKDTISDVWNNKYMQAYRNKVFNNQYEDFCNPNCIGGRVVESYLKFL
jgi:MoaA/NifB/PqqE/SkfB family radical SAM enzyme